MKNPRQNRGGVDVKKKKTEKQLIKKKKTSRDPCQFCEVLKVPVNIIFLKDYLLFSVLMKTIKCCNGNKEIEHTINRLHYG